MINGKESKEDLNSTTCLTLMGHMCKMKRTNSHRIKKTQNLGHQYIRYKHEEAIQYK